METNKTYPIDLITRYLSGEAEGDDLVFLEAWLKADPENRRVFGEYRQTLLELERVKMEDTLNIDVAWNGMESRMRDMEAPARGVLNVVADQEKPNYGFFHIQYQQFLRIAAIILVILIPSFFIIRSYTLPEQKQLEASLTIQEGNLPDGTVVTLNKGASLEYPSSFRGNTRNVKLNGEAYFEVMHNPTKPFIITSQNVKIEVLGTSFYVNSKGDNNTMEVILNSGSVAVYFEDHKENAIFLLPGEKADINSNGEKMLKDINADQNYRSWMTQHFIFNHTPLVTIVDDLNKVYHANLRITTPIISSCLVTATFDHQSLESILHVLQATLDLNISPQGTYTDISGDKCN
jgi:ferric-dicitrate binding protein FerR (iron transport regulator)